jgi:hypothetical protein
MAEAQSAAAMLVALTRSMIASPTASSVRAVPAGAASPLDRDGGQAPSDGAI